MTHNICYVERNKPRYSDEDNDLLTHSVLFSSSDSMRIVSARGTVFTLWNKMGPVTQPVTEQVQRAGGKAVEPRGVWQQEQSRDLVNPSRN